MTSNNSELPPEQQEAEEIVFQTQRIASQRFCRKHPEFKVGKPNADKIGTWIRENNKSWDQDSLEEAFEAIRGNLELHPEPKADPLSPPEAQRPSYPWGELTKAGVREMDNKQLHKYMKNPAFIRQFENVINNRGQYE